MSQESCAPASGIATGGSTYAIEDGAGVTWPPLNLHDRCDACGAAGRVRTARTFQDMVWCGHHWRQHEAALVSSGWAVVEAL